MSADVIGLRIRARNLANDLRTLATDIEEAHASGALTTKAWLVGPDSHAPATEAAARMAASQLDLWGERTQWAYDSHALAKDSAS